MTDPHYEAPTTVEQIVKNEKRWIEARKMIDTLVEHVVHDMPIIAQETGLSDASQFFDFTLHWVKLNHRAHPYGSQITEILLAAAMTKLAHKMTGRDNDMTQFERDATK